MAYAEAARICSRGTGKALCRSQSQGLLRISFGNTQGVHQFSRGSHCWSWPFAGSELLNKRSFTLKQTPPLLPGQVQSLKGAFQSEINTGFSSSSPSISMPMASSSVGRPCQLASDASDPSATITKEMSGTSLLDNIVKQPVSQSEPSSHRDGGYSNLTESATGASCSFHWRVPEPNPNLYTGESPQLAGTLANLLRILMFVDEANEPARSSPYILTQICLVPY